MLEPETSLDAQVARRNGMIVWRRDLYDRVVLGMQGEAASHTAIRADCRCLLLGAFVPGVGLAHVVLGLEHERTSRTHLDTVAAVHARGIG